MDTKNKTTDPASEVNPDSKPREAWLEAETAQGSEPGIKPAEKEKPEDAWVDEEEKEKLEGKM